MSSFLNAHPAAAGFLVVVFLVCTGYIEKRLFSETPIVAASSWIMALLIACLVLSGLPASGPMGIVFIVVSIALGIAGIARILGRGKGPN